ncbi:hypothetical protein HAHE_17300 [Haloferula helveola]|uniref:BD-FAE-like domain-containing protein n=1 Tax=Haloferula helveola TaxID=490095 RepID=A0ABM7RL87_9BACT|nr:hypothetical protein HAHE_17300 [Haloferula helveola]
MTRLRNSLWLWTSSALLSSVAAQERPLANLRLAESVEVTRDVSYADTDNPRQRLDLVLPKAREGKKPLPVVVFVHGGGWQSGDKRQAVRRLVPLVASGDYAGVSVGYRLTDEAQWPAQMHDCKAAIRWIRANADKHGLDPDKIAVWGTSAGGHLVAVLGTSAGVEAMDGKLGPNTAESTKVTCVVDFFGPTDFSKMSAASDGKGPIDHDAPNSPESKLVGGAIQEHPDKVAAANPITYVDAGDPPFLIIHGTKDPLVPFNQSELLDVALEKVEVPSTLVAVKDAGHGQGFGPETNQLVSRFLKHHLRGEKSEWKDHEVPAGPMRPRR